MKINLRRKRNENFDKINELQIELVKFKYVNNPNKIQSELRRLNKIHVIDRNLHEIKNEILGDHASE